jgi:hypothetical protein
MSTDERNYSIEFQEWVAQIDPSYHSFRQGSVGPGWKGLLSECFEQLRQAGWSGNILQIKEKFGALRLYVTGQNPTIDEIINHFEERSRTVCEECGAPGSTRNSNGWLSTVCDLHYKGAQE